MPTTPTYSPGDAVVVVDPQDLNFLQEGVVVPWPRDVVAEPNVIRVQVDGDRLAYMDYQLRSGRLGDGIQCVYLHADELIALVRKFPGTVPFLPPEKGMALGATSPSSPEVIDSARASVAAAFMRMWVR